MSIVYNEIDPVACAVLRHLSSENIIAPGLVVERSIKDIHDLDLVGITQFHGFAGAGLWSVAARLAGWPDERPLWTASVPCQPFSAAGTGKGFADDRDLWPDFLRLVRACRPEALAGEQVANAVGKGWLDRAGADMEAERYDFQCVSVPACAVDTPHIRQRIWWCAIDRRMGHSMRSRTEFDAAQGRSWSATREPDDRRVLTGALADAAHRSRANRRVGNGTDRQFIGALDGASDGSGDGRNPARDSSLVETRSRASGISSLADADGGGHRGRTEDAQRNAQQRDAAERAYGDVAFAERWGREGDDSPETIRHRPGSGDARQPNGSFWSGAEWLACADGKARRAKPGVRLLVDGMAGRADLWRLAGNSIVPQLAAQVLIALKDEIDSRLIRVTP